MHDSDSQVHGIKFYSLDDLSLGFYVERAGEIIRGFSASEPPSTSSDVLDLHEALLFAKNGVFPSAFDDKEVSATRSKIRQIEGTIARYFGEITEDNLITKIAGTDFEYQDRLLELLGKYGIYIRCNAAVTVAALMDEGIHLRQLLAEKNLVKEYDTKLRELLINSPRGAEIVIEHWLSESQHDKLHLPKSLTPADSRELLNTYVGSDKVDQNCLKLLSEAKNCHNAGIDDKTKLKAKRRYDSEVSKFFEGNQGMRYGSEIIFSSELTVPWKVETDNTEDLIIRMEYSTQWLDKTCDYPSVLNNFVHLFGFTEPRGMLTFPAYRSQMGIFEQLLGTSGKHEYKTGITFNTLHQQSISQIHLYRGFLESKGINLEEVISWFFSEYLPEEFGAEGFSFSASESGAPFLQRVRHLFPEMEAIAHQFCLYAEDGEIDHELLTFGSKQVRYKNIPSLLTGKYSKITDDKTIAAVLQHLYSDQSLLSHTKSGTSGPSAIHLFLIHKVAYTDFHPHQQEIIDFLIALDILRIDQSRISFVRTEQLVILESLFKYGAVSYYHLSDAGRAEADKMSEKGWLKSHSYLLTEAEADYFNYYLNSVDFSNGPKLRNKYAHGTQPKPDGETEHYNAYLIALRMILSLVIKINDEFCLVSPDPDSPNNRQILM